MNEYLSFFAVKTINLVQKEEYSKELYEDLKLALLFGNMDLSTVEFTDKRVEEKLYRKYLSFTTIYKIDHKRFMHKIVKIAKSKLERED